MPICGITCNDKLKDWNWPAHFCAQG